MKPIEELTVGEAIELLANAAKVRAIFGMPDAAPVSGVALINHPWVGKAVFIRTVTHHLTGRVKEINEREIVLTDAAWIAENGRFYDVLRSGEFSEVEPFPDGEVRVGYAALIDWQLWHHKLPKNQK